MRGLLRRCQIFSISIAKDETPLEAMGEKRVPIDKCADEPHEEPHKHVNVLEVICNSGIMSG